MKASRTLILNALLIVVLLVSCYTPSDTDSTPTPTDSYSSEQIVGTPLRFGNFVVAQNDFPKEMFWEDAQKACVNLGSGWRLPTIDELDFMYTNKVEICGFSDSDSYWSSTETSSTSAWRQNFNDGSQLDIHKLNPLTVRAVRSF